jgi:hypothetical protein
MSREITTGQHTSSTSIIIPSSFREVAQYSSIELEKSFGQLVFRCCGCSHGGFQIEILKNGVARNQPRHEFHPLDHGAERLAVVNCHLSESNQSS